MSSIVIFIPRKTRTLRTGDEHFWFAQKVQVLARNVLCPQVALAVKNPPANAGDLRDAGSIPGSGRSPHKIPFGQSSLVFLPEESHRQRSLAGYSPQGRAELDTPEAL